MFVGPIRVPMHLRPPFHQADVWIPKALTPSQTHPSWVVGSCPVAERRCAKEEIVLTSSSRWLSIPQVRINQIVETIRRVGSYYHTIWV